MPKKCIKQGCNYNQFGGNFCLNHQYLRTDKKPKILKRTKASRSQIPLKKELREKDWFFFIKIWDERPHVDFETDEPIYGEPVTLYFHHVLPKKQYPQYRYLKWNIVLVTWATHSKAETNIDFVPKIKVYREQLLKQIEDGNY